MVRIILSCLLLFISFQLSFGKSVNENTAKTAGYNFCKTQGATVNASDLSLVYTATSVINGSVVNDFYIFNTGSKGFVIVAADDNVVPVLAYSTESSFRAGYMPGDIGWWLNKYSAQINSVISRNGTAAVSVQIQWNDLMQTQINKAARITNIAVLPLLTTYWNQTPYYNYLCPFDYSAGTNVVTGCVATAMAQVMKYWNWPERGVGSNSYNSGYGLLSADFGTTVYQWDSMKGNIDTDNFAIGTLMYQAGVSVDMDYGVGGSSAAVLNYGDPSVNCTQNALPGYFSYKTSLQAEIRSSYTDSDWVYMLQAELDTKRPIIYTGYGDSGGHCFVADGYNTYDRFHFNWGWGGYADGYYIIENLDPDVETFNQNQSVIIGIEPDSSIIAGVKEIANKTALLVYPNPATTEVTIDLTGTNATQVSIIDALGREVMATKISSNTSLATIEVSKLMDGDYFAEIHTPAGVVARKIVIAR